MPSLGHGKRQLLIVRALILPACCWSKGFLRVTDTRFEERAEAERQSTHTDGTVDDQPCVVCNSPDAEEEGPLLFSFCDSCEFSALFVQPRHRLI